MEPALASAGRSAYPDSMNYLATMLESIFAGEDLEFEDDIDS
ncbi:hypothetical protein [Leucobacter sp. G161]|nr:hypothetical protein [Leucobacter sp. G161]